MAEQLLEVRNVRMYFPITKGLLRRTVGYVKAVDDISFTMAPGETLGVVGESGCGKSTLGKVIMRIHDVVSGEILFDGKPITQLKGKQLRQERRQFQMIFQDPYASLNPRMRVREILVEPMLVNRLCGRKEAIRRAGDLLEKVGLTREDMDQFPHQFSGGQRQRICIARALSLNPRLIVADEAVSALDVSIQAQILNLMEELRRDLGLSYIFVSHNLAVVKHISEKVMVMYLGSMVEYAPKELIFHTPLHPYTKALLAAAPDIKRAREDSRAILQGDVPNPANPPSGCPFRTRCPSAMESCSLQKPTPVDMGGGHIVACHLYRM